MEDVAYEKFETNIELLKEMYKISQQDRSLVNPMDFETVKDELEELYQLYEEKDQQFAFECGVVSEYKEHLKQAVSLLGQLYDKLVEMPSISSSTKDLLGETDDFIKQFDDVEL